MLSIQHLLCSRLQDTNYKNRGYMAALVFPDAIRAYTGARQYSHFEVSSDGTDDTSYWAFPADIKHLSRESVKKDLESFGHLSKSIDLTIVIGEPIDISVFYEYNENLPPVLFRGIEDHLKQDNVFDIFIRDLIDCTTQHKNEFLFKGETLNGVGVRKLIAELEQYGIYVLAHEIYVKFGEIVNQDWLAKNIKPILYEQYSEDLARVTYSYMKIDEDINECITHKDWSRLDNGPVTYEKYRDYYKEVIRVMNLPCGRVGNSEIKFV